MIYWDYEAPFIKWKVVIYMYSTYDIMPLQKYPKVVWEFQTVYWFSFV